MALARTDAIICFRIWPTMRLRKKPGTPSFAASSMKTDL